MPFYNENLQTSSVTLESIKVDSKCLVAFNKVLCDSGCSGSMACMRLITSFSTLGNECSNSELKDDVASFMLLAILVANSKRSCFDDPQAWANEFVSALNTIGFVSSNAGLNQANLRPNTTVSQAVLENIDDQSREPIKQAVTAIGQPENKVALRALNMEVKGPGNTIACLMAYSSADSYGNATTEVFRSTEINCYFGRASKFNDNVLETGVKPGDQIMCGKTTGILGKHIADRFRRAVMDKLGQRFKDNVKDVQF
ncbi:unnamed protein product [Rhizoctonia solani]|uniref:Uncharacterized protein n=1 Tax=Rhizoctonia solani TaxID=456999 RepID=A0A8H3HGN3_9AGAM|nr:unnamed protein product [Rhizoctonia solani]